MKSGQFYSTFMQREENTVRRADRSILGPYIEGCLSELASD